MSFFRVSLEGFASVKQVNIVNRVDEINTENDRKQLLQLQTDHAAVQYDYQQTNKLQNFWERCLQNLTTVRQENMIIVIPLNCNHIDPFLVFCMP